MFSLSLSSHRMSSFSSLKIFYSSLKSNAIDNYTGLANPCSDSLILVFSERIQVLVITFYHQDSMLGTHWVPIPYPPHLFSASGYPDPAHRPENLRVGTHTQPTPSFFPRVGTQTQPTRRKIPEWVPIPSPPVGMGWVTQWVPTWWAIF